MATMVSVPVQGFVSHQQAVLSSFPTCSGQTSVCDATCAVEAIVAEHMPMVRSVARRIHRSLPRHIELDDLISAGYLGLVDAAQKFEESRQTQFRAYAEFRVRGAILDSLRELDWGTRSLRRKMRDVEEARKALTHSLGRAPEESELAGELGVPVSQLRETVTEARGLEVESLQAEREDEEGQDLLGTLVDPTAQDALTLCLEGEFKQALVDAIDGLPERDRLVITLSYYEELTLKEVGEVLGLTVSRVSQIRTGAVNKMRAALQAAR